MDYGLYALNTTRMPGSLTSSRLILMTVLSLTLTKSGGLKLRSSFSVSMCMAESRFRKGSLNRSHARNSGRRHQKWRQ